MLEEKLVREETLVEKVLRTNVQARNSDKELIKLVLHEKFGTANLDNIPNEELPSFETITRARRKLQERGKYKAESEVEEQRDMNQLAYSFVFGN